MQLFWFVYFQEAKNRLDLLVMSCCLGEISEGWIPAISVSKTMVHSKKKLLNAEDNWLPEQFVISGEYVKH